MTTLYLIRHGENDFMRQHKLAGWLPGIHLNERGRAQAEALVSLLEGVHLQVVYSSPLERATETAAPLARARGLRVERRSGLGETRYGRWEGQSIARLRRLKLWSQLQTTPSLVTIPDGESLRETQARIVRELERILSQHSGAVACFSHADPIKLALAHYLGQPIDLFQRLTIEPASVSTLLIQDGRVRVQAVNDTRATRAPTSEGWT
jgi:probable phosphomutase (TIGR03848 family)